jgi:hypothetical protein
MIVKEKTHNSMAGHSPTGDVRGTVKNAEALQAATRGADREAELKRYKRIGLALIFGSYGSFVLPADFRQLAVVTYLLLSVVGVLLFATSKERRPWWSVLGLIPVLGPLLSLVILSRKPRKKDFSRGRIESIVASIIGIGLTAPWLLGVTESIYLPEDQWYPRQPVGAATLLLFASPFILISVGSIIAHLRRYELTSKFKSFLITETIFAGFFLLSFFGAFLVTSKVIDVNEVRSERVLSQLRVGMIKYNVEVLVFEANAVLTRPPKKGWVLGTTEYENEVYRGVQQALEAARAGYDVDLSVFDGSEYFALHQDKEDPSVQLFRRIYFLGPFRVINYELLVKYDDTDRLLWARYRSRAYYDGSRPCRVVYVGDSAPAWNSDLCQHTEEGWKATNR